MNASASHVDHSALRTNQAAIILLNLAAFVLDAPELAAVVAVTMLAGTIGGAPAFGFLYRYWLKPKGWLAPDVIPDHPQPHRFAQGFGALVMIAGAGLLFSGFPVIGWLLVWVVIALAALNLFAGFCAGCAIYYWLSRMHVPGFTQSLPDPRTPGLQPEEHS